MLLLRGPVLRLRRTSREKGRQRVCQGWLEVGAAAQERWGLFKRARATGARARCAHTLEKGHCQSASQKHYKSRQEAQEAQGARGGGRGESVAAAQQGKHLARAQPDARFWQAEPVTLRLLEATATCHCNKGSQSAESTAEVSLRRRALLRARQLVLRRWRVVAWFRPNRTTSHCHPMHSLCWRKQLLHAMWLRLQWCPPTEAAGVRLIGPFLQVHVVSIAWQLAAAPRHCPRPQPSAFHLTLV
jgi:hypothetical protein